MSDENAGGQNDTSTADDSSATDDTSNDQTTNQDTDTGDQSGQDTGDKGGKGGEGDQAASDGDDVVIPETYEFTMPEGVEMDAALAEAATPVFKDMGIDQAGADKLTGMFASWQNNQVNDAAKAFGEQLDSWAKELKSDKDFGGDDYEENSGIADLAVEKLGSQELRDFLQASGGCNHPAVVKFMWAVGKLVSEDTPGGGDQGGEKEGSIESRMYPNEAKKAS